MGRLTVAMQSSIDGFVSSDDPDARWQLWDWGPHWPWTSDLRDRFNDLLAAAGGILLSRPMVGEGYLDHWRRVAEEHPDDPDYAFAARIGRLPKTVVTSRALSREWPRTAVLAGGLAEGVRRAKRESAGDLVCFGGAGFVAALLAAGLVDELQLFINPGVAGRGRSVFVDIPSTQRFTLREASATECGIIVARWGLSAESGD